MGKKRGPRQNYQLYSESIKAQVVRDYQSGYSIGSLQRKYGIKGHSTIKQWLLSRGLLVMRRKKYLTGVQTPPKSNPSGSNPTNGTPSLEQQLKALQEQLQDANLRAEMLERMIEIAEQDHQISIRKKGDTR